MKVLLSFNSISVFLAHERMPAIIIQDHEQLGTSYGPPRELERGGCCVARNPESRVCGRTTRSGGARMGRQGRALPARAG